MLVDILKPIFFLAPKLYNPPMYSNATESSTMVWICNFAKKCFDCKQGWDLICSFAEIAHDKWANVSNRSCECERFAPVVQEKWANVSDSLRTNERMWAIRSGQKSHCERITQDARDKWAKCSDCSMLMTYERMWGIRSAQKSEWANHSQERSNLTNPWGKKW